MPVHRIRSGDDTFRAAIDAMTDTRQRQEFAWRTIPAPSRMAPSTWACTGEIVVHDEELASGRLVILHDPAGQEAWDGTYRMVALVQAQLEPEFAIESMLGDVAWSWVTESLELHDAEARELGCTATRVVSQSYGALASRASTVDVEMRVSWTPEPRELPAPREPSEEVAVPGSSTTPEGPVAAATRPPSSAANVGGRAVADGPEGPDGDVEPEIDLAPHFAAWTAMLAAAGGLPPAPPRIAPIAPTHVARAPRPAEEGEAR
ncbi:DUF3000 family protein [Brachybacterium sp. AOP43-C2-M15]|uniref:DUF3000 family protein n=1 Tax=Brachybacterium sp. AOP43-C2-M15 TaxID=3457661 RepID=UPI0040343579